MSRSFSLDCADTLLRARTTASDWHRILVLRNHPSFLRGLFAYDELMPEFFAYNVILNKVVTEAWRFEMLVYTLHLYDTRDPADPTSGLTVANLTRICARQQTASRGRVAAILGLMQLARFLYRRRSHTDGRIVHLEPSKEFVQIVEDWNQLLLQIIDAIDATDGLARDHRAHPRFGWDMRERGAQVLLGGWKMLDPFPEVNHFVTSDGGWMLLLSCVAETLRSSNGSEIEPVALNLGTFGARFGVSRSHLRRLLESAYDLGLLDAPPRNGQHIVLSQRLVASFLTCMASELGNYRLWALETKKVLTKDVSQHGKTICSSLSAAFDS